MEFRYVNRERNKIAHAGGSRKWQGEITDSVWIFYPIFSGSCFLLVIWRKNENDKQSQQNVILFLISEGKYEREKI